MLAPRLHGSLLIALAASLNAACGSEIRFDEGEGGAGEGGATGISVGIGAGPSSGTGASGSGSSGAGASGSGSSGSSGVGSSSSGGGSTATSSSSGGGWTASSSSSGGGASASSSSGSSSTGSWSSGFAASSSSGGPFCPGAGDSCTNCAATACPGEWCACSGEADCVPLLDCWDACQTEACFQTCMTNHPSGVSAAVLLNSCASNVCPGCQQGWEPLDPCSECIFTSCDAAMNACYALPACIGLWTCLGECSPLNLSCQQGCYNSFGAGVSTLQTALECADSQCPSCN